MFYYESNYELKFKSLDIIYPLIGYSEDSQQVQFNALFRLIKYSNFTNYDDINKKTFGFFVDDPTNNNDKFLRTRIRKLVRNLNKEGLNFDKFYLTLKNLSKSNQVIEFFVEKNVVDNTKYFQRDKKTILNKSFFDNLDEIILRSFIQVIQHIGKKKNYPRGKKVVGLVDSLKSSNKNVKLTLSGCIIKKINDSVIIYPEK